MKYLNDLLKENNHKLVAYNQVKSDYNYMTVFDYSIAHGGTYDSFKYYNNYVIEIS